MRIKVFSSGQQIESQAKTLSEIRMNTSPEYTISSLMNKSSESIDVFLNEDFLNVEILYGVRWKDVIDNLTPDKTEYGMAIKSVCFHVDDKGNNNYVLKSNGKEVVEFDLNESKKDDYLYKEINEGIKAIDYVIGGEFHPCIMAMRDLYENLAKVILGDQWDKEYQKIINVHFNKNEETKQRVEFSNFWAFNDTKSKEIDEMTAVGVSNLIADLSNYLRGYRNTTAHDLRSLVGRGKVGLSTAISNMMVVASNLNNHNLVEFLESQKKKIEELFDMRTAHNIV